MNTPLRRSGMARVIKGSHSFTCTPRVPLTEWTVPGTAAAQQSWSNWSTVSKMTEWISATSWSSFFCPVGGNTTRGHNWKLQIHCRTDTRFHFSQQTVNRLNCSSHKHTDATTLNGFKKSEKKKSRNGLIQRLTVDKVLLAARPSRRKRTRMKWNRIC